MRRSSRGVRGWLIRSGERISSVLLDLGSVVLRVVIDVEMWRRGVEVAIRGRGIVLCGWFSSNGITFGIDCDGMLCKNDNPLFIFGAITRLVDRYRGAVAIAANRRVRTSIDAPIAVKSLGQR